ncbi:MAG: hypothetical protein ACTSXU_01290, partial [Promethearchaeota archaeon]
MNLQDEKNEAGENDPEEDVVEENDVDDGDDPRDNGDDEVEDFGETLGAAQGNLVGKGRSSDDEVVSGTEDDDEAAFELEGDLEEVLAAITEVKDEEKE